MRILIIEFISLDGVVQAPGGPDEDTDGGFAHGGWSHPFFDPEVVGGGFDDALTKAEALLFGRRTWQRWPPHGPSEPATRSPIR
jgi:dihydrofolate reductase